MEIIKHIFTNNKSFQPSKEYSIKKILHFIAAILFAVQFGGCPHHIEEQISKTMPEDPKNYKPMYMTSTVEYDNILNRLKDDYQKYYEQKAIFDKEGKKISDSTKPREPLVFDVRNVTDNKYPDEIELRSYVYDNNGKFVMGLAPPYLKDKDYKNYWSNLIDSCGGAANNIADYTVTEVREDKREPYSIAFVLDHSGSMGDTRIVKLRESVKRILGLIKKGDYISVSQFSGSIFTEVPLTNDSSVYKNKFEVQNFENSTPIKITINNNKNKTSPKPNLSGGTALYDAAYEGINEIAKAPKQCKRVLILFTDGGDNASQKKIEAVQQLAKKENVLVYTIAYGNVEEEILKAMAEYNGGKMYRIYSNREFPFVFADIYRRLNNYYKISYKPIPCNGLHYAIPTLLFSNFSNLKLQDTGVYDRTVFTPFDTIGSLIFANIEFEYNKATIKPESQKYITEVGNALKKYPKIVIEVRGHTDDVGSEEFNLKLSQDRAKAVMNELIDFGISTSRLTYKGFGKSSPIANNETEENRKKNRRTEFVILAK